MAEAKRRVIAGPLTWERPENITRSDAAASPAATFVVYVGRPFWSYRYEIGLAAGIVGLWLAAKAVISLAIASVIMAFSGATVVTAGVIGSLLWWEQSRLALRAFFSCREVRRAFDSACRYGLVVSMNDRTPKPKAVTATPAGHVLTVEMPPGLSTLPLADSAEGLASTMGVREVRVIRDRDRANRATVSIIRRDPLGEKTALAWPNRQAPRLSLWNPVPVGVDDMGETVSMNLIERNVSIGGEPGGGKSVSQSMIVATAALDPDCDLYLFDGNQVEFAPWASCAAAFVGPSLEQATEVLSSLRFEMDRRYSVLMAEGRRKIAQGDGFRPIVIVVNELAYYLNTDDKNASKAVAGLMRDLVARGRAAGLIMVTATQKPSADVIPTYLRDLFSYRWALRCSTPQASDTVLGAGWASRGFSAAEIDSGTRGVGLLLTEGSEPRRIKSFYLSDDELSEIAARGAALRSASSDEGGEDLEDRPAA